MGEGPFRQDRALTRRFQTDDELNPGLKSPGFGFWRFDVDYGNASMSLVGGELVLTYGNVGRDSLTISDGAVMADILVVGGGGGGGGSYGNTSSVAGGGVERTSAIASGTFGKGGAASGGSGIVESEPDGYFIGDPFFARYVRS